MVTGGEDKKVNMWAVGKPNCIMVMFSAILSEDPDLTPKRVVLVLYFNHVYSCNEYKCFMESSSAST